MTLPDERTRNILQAGAFLKELAGNKAVPQEVRQEAYRLLRHYPTLSDIEVIAQREEELYQLAPSIFHRPYLTSNIEDEWFRSYPKGPHKD
ncbi:BPSL0761 family protein [Xanthomonas campestris pv. raphani]|uniref:BPSL0761 family protein n=1 Tax=Xanthomonas campestris TaxID=339 RepID=UPI002B23DD57|nr:BPSL0761 family protein [Xanthomonas campestris]MEA9773494.1 BPSL0761 family protein [Xanthomonas campestris pv. raphani]MEA9801701.1 BPSL0761 family protein [Xanthomonas campestris pv. raphani]